jgi:hypoxanthine-guanine phosphoribosyltransferase
MEVIMNWQESLARVHVGLRERASDAGAQASMAGRYAEPVALFLQLLGGSDEFSLFIKSQIPWHLSLDGVAASRFHKTQTNRDTSRRILLVELLPSEISKQNSL